MLDSRLTLAARAMPKPFALRREGLPGAWRERLWLPDGRELLLRPIEPADAVSLQRAFPLLNAQEVRLRFQHPVVEMSDDLARSLTQLNRKRQFALVLAEPLPPGEALVGAVVRAAIDDTDEQRAEFAILVSHFLTGMGLGRLLMKRILFWARLKRLREIYGDVLEENTPMLRLAESLGFRREHRIDEPGLTRVRLSLRSD